MINFTKITQKIDSELRPEWQPGAFAWADEHMADAHKRAVDRMENAMVECGKRSDWTSLQIEAELYCAEMLKIFKAFKAAKSLSEFDALFKNPHLEPA